MNNQDTEITQRFNKTKMKEYKFISIIDKVTGRALFDHVHYVNRVHELYTVYSDNNNNKT